MVGAGGDPRGVTKVLSTTLHCPVLFVPAGLNEDTVVVHLGFSGRCGRRERAPSLPRSLGAESCSAGKTDALWAGADESSGAQKLTCATMKS